MRFLQTLIVAAALVLAGVGTEARAAIIYDNTTTQIFPGTLVFTALQIGDEVNAAGTERLVTLLQIGVSQQGVAGTADMVARLFANDGPGGMPGTQLWESPLRTGVPLTGGIDLIPFDVPMVQVPDTFTWTIQISNAVPLAVGLPDFNPPTVGSSPDYAWFGGPGIWTRQTTPSPVNFMARVTAVAGPEGAVPEPGSACLLATGMGVVLWLGVRWRR
jgi:hypothetical protein